MERTSCGWTSSHLLLGSTWKFISALLPGGALLVEVLSEATQWWQKALTPWWNYSSCWKVEWKEHRAVSPSPHRIYSYIDKQLQLISAQQVCITESVHLGCFYKKMHTKASGVLLPRIITWGPSRAPRCCVWPQSTADTTAETSPARTRLLTYSLPCYPSGTDSVATTGDRGRLQDIVSYIWVLDLWNIAKAKQSWNDLSIGKLPVLQQGDMPFNATSKHLL